MGGVNRLAYNSARVTPQTLPPLKPLRSAEDWLIIGAATLVTLVGLLYAVIGAQTKWFHAFITSDSLALEAVIVALLTLAFVVYQVYLAHRQTDIMLRQENLMHVQESLMRRQDEILLRTESLALTFRAGNFLSSTKEVQLIAGSTPPTEYDLNLIVRNTGSRGADAYYLSVALPVLPSDTLELMNLDKAASQAQIANGQLIQIWTKQITDPIFPGMSQSIKSTLRTNLKTSINLALYWQISSISGTNPIPPEWGVLALCLRA